jgi:hypothetical protein
MAQTTGAVSARNCVVEFSTNGSSWTDCSGFANVVTPDGGDRQTGTAPTFDGDTMILVRGKRETIKVKLAAIYTEGAAEVSTVARTAWRAGTDFYLRWTVKPATTGNTRYTTTAGVVVGGVLPEVDITKADPVALEIEVEVADITDAVIP